MFKIYVGNLSYKTPEAAIRKMFEPYGANNEIILVKDPDTGKPRGFAFVLVGDELQGRAAIAKLNGTPIDGRRLVVNASGDKKQVTSGYSRTNQPVVPGRSQPLVRPQGPLGPQVNRRFRSTSRPRFNRRGSSRSG